MQLAQGQEVSRWNTERRSGGHHPCELRKRSAALFQRFLTILVAEWIEKLLWDTSGTFFL